MDLETTKFRFTHEDVQEADDLQFGFCLTCGEVREGCEPDAMGYACEACGEASVYGPHWIAIAGLIAEDAA